ncbi:cupin domain-containing protein [Klenkia terrae]|uniref:Cupin domain-containing protein n=1 Tax=Klenkia terrae TaxID=1052259 RepID=A0ABU8E684_9ACTN
MSVVPPARPSRAEAEAVPRPGRGYLLGADEGVPGRGPEVKASNESTGGSLAVYRSVLDGAGPPPHQHRLEDETIIVLEGTVEAECGDDVFRGDAASTIFLPRGLTHTFRSVDGPATFLFVVTPGHLDEMFRAREAGGSREEMIDLVRRFF